MKILVFVLLLLAHLQAQYRGVITSKDHIPGNISVTDSSFSSSSSSGEIKSSVGIGGSNTITDQLTIDTAHGPISRSYYLWAERTGAILLQGGVNEVLLAALTVNAYEDVSQIVVTGPKTGVSATRWDLPLKMTLSYAASTGSTAVKDGSAAPTTATTYARSGSSAGFTSTALDAPSVGFSYKTSQTAGEQGDWNGPYNLFSGGNTDYSLTPMDLPDSVRPFTQANQWVLSFALTQSSLREVEALTHFTVYPYPSVTSVLLKDFGVKVGESLPTSTSPTTRYDYNFVGSPIGFPSLLVSATNGFPLSKWQLVHVNPSGNTVDLVPVVTGTNPGTTLAFPAQTLVLGNLLKENGVHYIRLYNRFEEAAVAEDRELVLEWKFTVTNQLKIKANIHTYQ